MEKIKIFIADDHALFRQGIAGVLLNENFIEVTGEAESAAGLLASEQLKESDILTLDISLGKDSGLDIIPDLRKNHPNLRILILSMHNKPMLIKRAVNIGAEGYFLKSSSPEKLVEAVKTIHSGERYLDSSLSDSIFTLLSDNESSWGTDSLYNSLSLREQEIFRLLAEGQKPAAIAKSLCISRKTVENHRSNITSKLRLDSPADIRPLAGKLGVI